MNNEEWEKQNKGRYSGTFCDVDDVVRSKETELISSFIQKQTGGKTILDVGCGNGLTISVLTQQYGNNNRYWGIDFTEEQINNAIENNINGTFLCEKIQSTSFLPQFFDIIFSQRCLINLFNWEEQKKALDKIHNLLKYNGNYLLIESFTDGLENYNRARTECGLSTLEPCKYNKYLDKDEFMKYIGGKFKIIEVPYIKHNFLSSHYFVARVLHALVTKGEQIPNTEFVKFFSHMPPIGDYSPTQAYLLMKI